MTRLEGALAELQLVPAKEVRLSCAAVMENGLLALRFSGSGELPDQAPLTLLLQRVHLVALKRQVPKVLVDMNGLKFMNSSCFKAFVSWLAALSATAQPQVKYAVHFRLNPTRRWQRVSISALACFAVDLVTFE